MVKREVIGAHYGLRDWLAQRVTAVVMTVYTLAFVAALAGMPQLDFASWKALWTQPWMRYATLLFLLSAFVHAWIGVRNILMDYVQHIGVRLPLYVAVILALVLYGAWSVQILWGL
ncbi:MAG: succinate dehydrogenase, hydrophobic membrane anchor protein [Betaproteobacteria bacterium]|nr:succinate dehydrogenase, hydrophobic membrane anchor protein [Betaproteobacteria bacterium]